MHRNVQGPEKFIYIRGLTLKCRKLPNTRLFCHRGNRRGYNNNNKSALGQWKNLNNSKFNKKNKQSLRAPGFTTGITETDLFDKAIETPGKFFSNKWVVRGVLFRANSEKMMENFANQHRDLQNFTTPRRRPIASKSLSQAITRLFFRGLREMFHWSLGPWGLLWCGPLLTRVALDFRRS